MLRQKLRITLIVDEDVAIESVSEQQDVLRVFEVDVSSGEQVGIETVEEEKDKDREGVKTFITRKKQEAFKKE